MTLPLDPAVTAKIVSSDADAAAWLALADECVGCIDPRAAMDLRESVRAGGTSSPGAIDALCRIILGLECDARDKEAASAHRAFEVWLGDAEREHGVGFGAHARALGVLLSSHNLFKDAVRVLSRAMKVADPEIWRTRCALGEALCEAGESEQSMEVLRAIRAESNGTAHSLFVRSTFARVALRMGAYDDAIELYRELSREEPTLQARRDAALRAALASRSSGDEPTARKELSAMVKELEGESTLATPFGANVADELLTLLLVAEDEDAIPIQESLIAAASAACGPTHMTTLQERANLAVVLRTVGRVEAADALVAELTTLRPEGLVFDRARPHRAPLAQPVA